MDSLGSGHRMGGTECAGLTEITIQQGRELWILKRKPPKPMGRGNVTNAVMDASEGVWPARKA